MEITDVRVYKVDREGSRVKGYATVKLDDCFVVRDIRIIQKEDGYIIAMPNRMGKDNKLEDVAHPINQETRKLFEDKIMEEYNKPSVEE